MFIIYVFFIILAIAVVAISFTLGYSYAKKNILIHLFKEKMISSEQYTKLEKTDI